jgi:hypothetical protein
VNEQDLYTATTRIIEYHKEIEKREECRNPQNLSQGKRKGVQKGYSQTEGAKLCNSIEDGKNGSD